MLYPYAIEQLSAHTTYLETKADYYLEASTVLSQSMLERISCRCLPEVFEQANEPSRV
jgi:hypothetical protein